MTKNAAGIGHFYSILETLRFLLRQSNVAIVAFVCAMMLRYVSSNN